MPCSKAFSMTTETHVQKLIRLGCLKPWWIHLPESQFDAEKRCMTLSSYFCVTSSRNVSTSLHLAHLRQCYPENGLIKIHWEKGRIFSRFAKRLILIPDTHATES